MKNEKCLYEIATGWMGEAYERAYVWTDAGPFEALKMFLEKYGHLRDADDCQIIKLFDPTDEPFVTDLSDSGFVIKSKEPTRYRLPDL